LKLPALLLALLAAPAAASDDVPFAQQAVILVRALAYDREIAAGAAGSIDIAILARPTTAGADKVLQAFKPLEKITVAGLPVKVVLITYTAPPELVEKLKTVDAVYIPAGLDDDVDGIVAAARLDKVTTFAAKRSYVERGASLGVFIVGDKPAILVNVAAAKAEGAAFSSELFKIAQVLK
jgi:hypothetical protein